MIKKLTPYIGEFKLPSLLTPLCMIAEVVCEMVIPLMIASLVDDGVTVGNLKHVVVMGLAMAAVSLLGLLFGSLGAIWRLLHPRWCPGSRTAGPAAIRRPWPGPLQQRASGCPR